MSEIDVDAKEVDYLEEETVTAFVCQKTGCTWVPRDPDTIPRKCPHCQSPNWKGDEESQAEKKYVTRTTVTKCVCQLCGNTWKPMSVKALPNACPRCKSPDWRADF